MICLSPARVPLPGGESTLEPGRRAGRRAGARDAPGADDESPHHGHTSQSASLVRSSGPRSSAPEPVQTSAAHLPQSRCHPSLFHDVPYFSSTAILVHPPRVRLRSIKLRRQAVFSFDIEFEPDMQKLEDRSGLAWTSEETSLLMSIVEDDRDVAEAFGRIARGEDAIKRKWRKVLWHFITPPLLIGPDTRK